MRKRHAVNSAFCLGLKRDLHEQKAPLLGYAVQESCLFAVKASIHWKDNFGGLLVHFTRSLFSERSIQKASKGCIVVNTARSSVLGNNPDIGLIQDITITGSNILSISFSVPLRPGSRDFYLNIYTMFEDKL